MSDTTVTNSTDGKSVAAPPLDPKKSLEQSDLLNPVARNAAEQLNQKTVSPTMVSTVMGLVDFVTVLICGLVAYHLYVWVGPTRMVYYGVAFVGAIIVPIVLEARGAYGIQTLRSPARSMSKAIGTTAVIFATLAIAGFFLKISEDFSRVWFALWFASSIAVAFVSRVMAARIIGRWSRNGLVERRAVIVGGGNDTEELIRLLEQDRGHDVRICGIFDDRAGERSPKLVAGYPKLGTVAELVEFARIARVDMLIVALPTTAEQRVLQLLKKLWVLPLDIRLSAHKTSLRFRPRSYSYIGNVPMLDIFDKPINGWDSVAKRGFDIFFSILGIVFLSPIMVATAVAIKLDSKGPVLFVQKRHGFNNEVIRVFKFRSMFTEMCDPTAVKAVTKGDPRVTKVGRFIRRTSIDELPQFFNVLRGDLSLVGPRPHAVAGKANERLFNDVVEGYFARHRVKPGVTGWAQINGWRGEIDSDAKIQARTQCDLYYIENWSLWFDLKILILTPVRLFTSENAY